MVPRKTDLSPYTHIYIRNGGYLVFKERKLKTNVKVKMCVSRHTQRPSDHNLTGPVRFPDCCFRKKRYNFSELYQVLFYVRLSLRITKAVVI